MVFNKLFRIRNIGDRASGQNDPTMRSKWHDGRGQNDPTNTRDYTETSSETTTNNSATDVTHEQFEEWWKLYDKKKDKKMSFTKFKSCLKKHSFEQIMQGTREYLKTITDKQYQKYPKTFLTNESYMNDYSEEIKETGIDQLERMKYDESYWD